MDGSFSNAVALFFLCELPSDRGFIRRKNVTLSLTHFSVRAIESGDLEKEATPSDLLKLLRQKIESLNFDRVKEDVVPFIPDPGVLDIWSKSYFLDLIQTIKIK